MNYFTDAAVAAAAKKKKKKTNNKSNTASFRYSREWNLNKDYTYRYINGWRGLAVKIQDCGNRLKRSSLRGLAFSPRTKPLVLLRNKIVEILSAFTENERLQKSWEPGSIPGAGPCLFRSTRPCGDSLPKRQQKMNNFQLNSGECLH